MDDTNALPLERVPLSAAAPGRLPSHHAHIPALDGLRGWAVLAVILYHFSRPVLNTGPHGHVWWAVLHLMLSGNYGVDVFFTLSGFLITGILLDSKQKSHYFRNFYMRRVLRIFPLYYGVLVVCFGCLWWTQAIRPFAHHQGWLWLYVANFAGLKGISFEPMFDHFWSLAVEEQFYLAWPLVVFLLSRRSLMKLCVALACCSLVLRCSLIAGGLDSDLAASLTPCRLEGLVFGALLAALARGPGGLSALYRRTVWIGAIAGIMVIGSRFIGRSSSGVWGPSGLGHLTVPLAVTCILAFATSGSGFWSSVFSISPLRFFGKYSYALYVFHYVFEPFLDGRFWYLSSFPVASLLLHMACAIGVTLAAALASWHLYERHFLKLKRFFDPDKESESPKPSLPGAGRASERSYARTHRAA